MVGSRALPQITASMGPSNEALQFSGQHGLAEKSLFLVTLNDRWVTLGQAWIISWSPYQPHEHMKRLFACNISIDG